MALNSKASWTLRLACAGLITAGLIWYQQYQKGMEARAETLRVVATVTAVPTYCRDDRQPFYVTIRNLTDRTVLEATFTLYETPLPAGTLPSDMPTVSLKQPLGPGQAHSACHALNRYRLIARGVDPRSIHFAAMPSGMVFR